MRGLLIFSVSVLACSFAISAHGQALPLAPGQSIGGEAPNSLGGVTYLVDNPDGSYDTAVTNAAGGVVRVNHYRGRAPAPPRPMPVPVVNPVLAVALNVLGGNSYLVDLPDGTYGTIATDPNDQVVDFTSHRHLPRKDPKIGGAGGGR